MLSYVTWWRCCSSDTASTASHFNTHNTALYTRVHHSRGLAGASLFAVKHYAGTVEYRAEGLTEANGDPALRGYIPPEVRDLLTSSTRGDILQVDVVTTHLQLVKHFAVTLITFILF
jgi:myosin heavy subunit